MKEIMRYDLDRDTDEGCADMIPISDGRYVEFEDLNNVTRLFLDATERCVASERREKELQKRLTAADERDDQRKELLQMFIDNSDDKDVVELCRHALKPAECGGDEAI